MAALFNGQNVSRCAALLYIHSAGLYCLCIHTHMHTDTHTRHTYACAHGYIHIVNKCLRVCVQGIIVAFVHNVSIVQRFCCLYILCSIEALYSTSTCFSIFWRIVENRFSNLTKIKTKENYNQFMPK